MVRLVVSLSLKPRNAFDRLCSALDLLCFAKRWASRSPSLLSSAHFGLDLEPERDRLLLEGSELDVESLGFREDLDGGEADLRDPRPESLSLSRLDPEDLHSSRSRRLQS